MNTATTAKKTTAKKQPTAPAITSPRTVDLNLVKSTPGTHVYGTEEREGVVCRQVYLAKGELPDPAPATIRMTIEFG